MLIKCYECQVKQVEEESGEFPFCSKECHTVWAGKHYQKENKMEKFSNFLNRKEIKHDTA